ncbi:hypothetical protein [Algibacillus agarilyticus]|uniref:hypothetical protein n=1 Tax=Algibacillus agarilyticus TaxID=2234133 RepID=UPI000DD0E1A6|nr:hypothetical protein [Algibacillus agarilyticus]
METFKGHNAMDMQSIFSHISQLGYDHFFILDGNTTDINSIGEVAEMMMLDESLSTKIRFDMCNILNILGLH